MLILVIVGCKKDIFTICVDVWCTDLLKMDKHVQRQINETSNTCKDWFIKYPYRYHCTYAKLCVWEWTWTCEKDEWAKNTKERERANSIFYLSGTYVSVESYASVCLFCVFSVF